MNRRVAGLHVRIFVSQSGYGLVQDATMVGRLLEGVRSPKISVEQCDPLTWLPPRDATGAVANIHIYVEQPCQMAMPWATYNVLIVNPEWFYVGAWDWITATPDAGGMDLFVFKDNMSAEIFRRRYPSTYTTVIPWCCAPMGGDSPVTWPAREKRFLFIIGGSINKAAAARNIVSAWKPAWPPLELWCAPDIAEELRPLVPTDCLPLVEFQTVYRPTAEKEARQKECAWHVVASAAEGFGFTAAEAAFCGVPMLWTDIPVYREMWGPALGDLGRIATVARVLPEGMDERLDNGWVISGKRAVEEAVEGLLRLNVSDVRRIQERLAAQRSSAIREFRKGWERVIQGAMRRAHASNSPQGPLRLRAGEELPMVGVITVTRNRRAWWPNMVENIQRQRWPVSRLVWVIVDDSDEGQQLAEEVVRLREKVPALSVVYLTAQRDKTLGAKRNAGVNAAQEAGATYALMMDDDDHYPESSVPERMRWLMRTPGVEAVACAMLPMYDITRYVSAMNVPPLKLAPRERVSEASVAFRIPADHRPIFADVSVAEGSGLCVAFPMSAMREIPPIGIIVSFIHSANTTSRRVPAESEPNGCHYGFTDDYFRYLHTIGGGPVE